jgi:hypothetical protein
VGVWSFAWAKDGINGPLAATATIAVITKTEFQRRAGICCLLRSKDELL